MKGIHIENLTGVRIVDCEFDGVDVGIESVNSDVEIVNTRIKANEAIRAGPNSRLHLDHVDFADSLQDIVQHFTADIEYLDTVVRTLRVYADDGRFEIPPNVRQDIARAASTTLGERARWMASLRVVRFVRKAAEAHGVFQLSRAAQDLIEQILDLVA